jgi:hypothetical protein
MIFSNIAIVLVVMSPRLPDHRRAIDGESSATKVHSAFFASKQTDGSLVPIAEGDGNRGPFAVFTLRRSPESLSIVYGKDS